MNSLTSNLDQTVIRKESVRPVDIAIVGMFFGRILMKNVMATEFGKKNLNIRAVCDLDPDKLSEGRRIFDCPGYDDLEKMLDECDAPAIGLFCGPEHRASLIRRIIRRGRHVMTTKPFEMDALAAMDVLAEAERLQRVVHMNSPSPLLSPDIRQIITWQDQYDLGSPIAANFSTWADYREKSDGSWYDDPRRCPAAPIFRLGIYGINDIVRLMGPPNQVFVMQSRLRTSRPTMDHAQMMMRFAGGELATVMASFCIDDANPWADRLSLQYQGGTIDRVVVNDPGQGRVSRLKLQLGIAKGNRTEEHEVVGYSGDYQWETFVAAVRGQKIPSELSHRHVIDGVRTLAALACSSETQQPESV